MTGAFFRLVPQNALSERSHDAICFLDTVGELYYGYAYKNGSAVRVACPDGKRTTVAGDQVALLSNKPLFKGNIEKAISQAKTLDLDPEVFGVNPVYIDLSGFGTS